MERDGGSRRYKKNGIAERRQLTAGTSVMPMKTMFWIILPQGFRIIIPPMTNELVLLLKDTSLVFIAGSFIWSKELTTFARDANTAYANATPLIVASLLYLVVTIPLTRYTAWLERRMARER